MARFFHYVLRTTDVRAARAFYERVLPRGGPCVGLEVHPLHEQAIAHGARPHWLGHLDVGDVEAAASAFGARGATPLGPRWVSSDGLEAAVVRDPGGAVISLAKPPRQATPDATGLHHPEVVWHELNSDDVERAKANYRELFGWEFMKPLDLGDLGVIHPFVWETGGAPVGSMSDVARRSGIHAHWLFHFRVAEIGVAVEAVRAGGGSVLPLITLPSGARVAVCDDPQGAAFALHESGGAGGRPDFAPAPRRDSP
jgi:predicted enzyme related to lactoylglutathione lyase